MYMIAIALLGAMLLSWSLATTEPQWEATRQQIAADSLAANFWAYRDALVAYQNAHPDTASTAITNLTGYLQPGYLAPPLASTTPEWSNYFDENRVLYTYTKTTTSCQQPPVASIPCIPAGVIDAIANYRGRSVMIGIAQTSTSMTSIFLLTDTIVLDGIKRNPVTSGYTQDPTSSSQVKFDYLPAAANIPRGALVVVGS